MLVWRWMQFQYTDRHADGNENEKNMIKLDELLILCIVCITRNVKWKQYIFFFIYSYERKCDMSSARSWGKRAWFTIIVLPETLYIRDLKKKCILPIYYSNSIEKRKGNVLLINLEIWTCRKRYVHGFLEDKALTFKLKRS